MKDKKPAIEKRYGKPMEQILRELLLEHPPSTVARILHVDAGTITHWRQRYGIEVKVSVQREIAGSR